MSGSIAICLTTLFSLTSAVSATKKDVLKGTQDGETHQKHQQDKEKEYKICEKLRRQPELSDLKILCREQLQSFEPVEPFKQFEAEPVEMFNKQLEPLAGRVLLTDLQDTELPEVVKNIPSIGYGFDYRGSAKYVVENIDSIDKMYLETVYCRYYRFPLEIAETDRLILREMQLTDLDSLYEVYDTLRDCPYIEPLYERAEEEEFTRQYIKNMYGFFEHGLWLVIRKEDNKVIGRAGIENREIDGELQKELGYLIGKPWQGKGYAAEACLAILDYVKERELCSHLFLCCHQKNIPSISLAQKLGFTVYAEDIDGMNLYCCSINL